MGHIIQLNGDAHEQTQRLLPWYANGTLDQSEYAAVEAHLAECAACLEELAVDRAFCIELAGIPIDVEQSWNALHRDMAARKAPRIRSFCMATPAFLRHPIPLGWALSAQAAALALMVGALRVTAPAQPVYQTLSAPPVAAPGNVVIVFRPDTTEQNLRAILARNDARLVDGPTVSDAYVLRVNTSRRDAIVSRLRADRNIVLVEPIDSGVTQ
jgi:anti-sigma factor RsiW